jgi:pyruvate dehydrogenase E1 component alpha subunit
MLTYRFGGHYVGDAEVYRDGDEVSRHRQEDPIVRWEAVLADEGWLDEGGRDEVWARAAEEVADAEAFAEASPLPAASSALEDVFTGGAA